jgi:hypothetical protein
MNLEIKNLMHVERDVAKHIKSTKKQFVWEFILDGKSHKIELFDSRLSGKKKVLKDGLILMQTEEDIAFIKSFDVGKHQCTLIQHGDKFELRIDNQSFNHLMDLEKNKIHFKNTTPTSTTYVAKPNVKDEKKIGFGISMAEISKPNDNRKPLFNFSIKPVTESTMQPNRFNFSVNDKNYKEETFIKHNKNVTSLIEIPDNTQQVTNQVPFKESKVNIIDLNKMELMGGINQDIFEIKAHVDNKVADSNQGIGFSDFDLNISNINNKNNNNGNDLMNAIENLYKDGGKNNM